MTAIEGADTDPKRAKLGFPRRTTVAPACARAYFAGKSPEDAVLSERLGAKRPADVEAQIEKLEAAVQARDEFLSIAAHDLRNPMHALALQASSCLRAARKEGSSALETRLERLVYTINRYVQRANLLLDVSRINAGRLHLRRERVDLADVLRETIASFDAEAEYHNCAIESDIPDSAMGEWDRIAVEQIAANLLSNAIKYGAGSPVQVALTRAGPDAVELRVTDHGVGISPENQERIFGRFEQVVTGEARAGFGIGLWLVRSLTEAHAGTIRLNSQINKGSTFTVRLPVEPDSTDESTS